MNRERQPYGGEGGEDGGFSARCSGQYAGLTGARVTLLHIGELSVPICLPARKQGRTTVVERERDERCYGEKRARA